MICGDIELVFEHGFLCNQGLGKRWVAPVDQRLVIAGTMEFSAANHPKVFIIISLSLYVYIYTHTKQQSITTFQNTFYIKQQHTHMENYDAPNIHRSIKINPRCAK